VRPIDVLLNETPTELLGLKLDTFWASLAGIDPVKMIERYRGRIPLVHLKDKARGTPVQYDETRVPKHVFKEIGQGEVDFGAFLPAAARAGVKYYYVEQDYCPGNPLDSLRLSRQALARAAAESRPPVAADDLGKCPLVCAS
jgi:sugar phosphate isomerase/epimerase